MTIGSATPSDFPEEANRRLAAIAHWRRRSRLVRFYRRALPLAMTALVLFGVGWVVVRAIVTAYLAPVEGAATIHLLHPRFYGRNDKGQPYVLSAAEAVRDGADPNRVALTLPVMTVYAEAPQPQVVLSDRGTYHEREKLLDLFGRVKATDGQDNHFASETAHINMPKNLVTGQTAVSGYGPQGTFSASSYAIYDKGAQVVLNGNVHAHLLNNSAPNAAAKPAAR